METDILCGKSLILASKPFAREIRSKSWWHTLSTLTLLVSAFAGAALLPNFVLRLVSSVLAGLLMIRMFIIYHDYQHHTILRHSWIAEVIMVLYGLFILAPASIWKRSHDHHHAHNSKLFSASIGSFPIVTKSKFLNMSRAERRQYLFTRHPLTITFGYFFMFIIGMCISSFTSAPRKHADSLLALVLHVVGSGLLVYFFGWQTWMLLILIPFFVSLSIGSYLFYAQHNFPGVEFADNKSWTYHKAALDSSSYMKMHPIMEFFTGNIGYHHIHHLNAKIPFYRLPETMKAFKELQQCKTTSLHPKDIIACFRLKIWDSEQKRMIGLKELKQQVA